MDLDEFSAAIRQFRDDREWEPFHDPKSLLIALVGEVGEVAELLQWLPAETARETARGEPLHSRLGEELSDVFIYLLQLADACGVDLARAAPLKLAAAAARYPIATARGVATRPEET